MAWRFPLFTWLVVLPAFAGELPLVVKSVAVPGTGLAVKLATQVGRTYDAGAVAKDVRYLWGLGRFEDIRVEASGDADGMAVVFHAKPAQRLRLHEIRIEPSTFGLEVKLPQGTPIDRPIAQQIAMRARRQLVERGYANARVGYEFAPHGSEVDLKLTVDEGEAIRVKQVEFLGETGLDPRALRGALRALRTRRLLPGIPHVWGGWRWLPSYSREAADSDAARLQSLYLAKGYFDATVAAREAETHGSEARITFDVKAGPRFDVRRWSIEGRAGQAWNAAPVCSALYAERRQAERQGILDFSVKMETRPDSPGGAEVVGVIERGQPYRVGRIEIGGNHHFSDASIRRNFVLEEGAPFDERLLRRSVARLNRTGWFENIDEKNVEILRDEKAGVAHIKLRLTERKAGKWNISGPVGPASLAGPLTASIGSRLPAWGRGLFELSTYTVSVSAFAFARPIVPLLSVAPSSRWPLLALQRPFTPGGGWLSGIALAPQIGWRGSAAGYGTTQLEQRLLPLLAGDRGLIPELPVTVNRSEGEAVMMCEPPRPRLGLMRTGAEVALRFLSAAAGL